jgi:hypothetical protein
MDYNRIPCRANLRVAALIYSFKNDLVYSFTSLNDVLKPLTLKFKK